MFQPWLAYPIVLFLQSDAGWEEYYDYIFPEDAANQPNLKLLAMAKLWKKQQQEKEAAEQDPDKDVDESDPWPFFHIDKCFIIFIN